MKPTTELCRVTTADGLLLDGVLFLPHPATAKPVATDVVLLVHGTGSNFTAPGVLETFARQAVDAGLPVLRINTRGHDGIASIPSSHGSVKGGATFETISEARDDLRAWALYLTERGFERITLVGHSMGGVKCLYTMAHEPLAGVSHIFGISPPRFCHGNFQSHPKAEQFRSDFARAEELVRAGSGNELMEVKQPLPFLVTAEGFLAKYGPHDDYDYLPLLARIDVPTRILVGSQTVETSPAFAGLPEQFAHIEQAWQHFSHRVVDGADINYRSCPMLPFEDFLAWASGDGTP